LPTIPNLVQDTKEVLLEEDLEAKNYPIIECEIDEKLFDEKPIKMEEITIRNNLHTRFFLYIDLIMILYS